nr:MAG TPA: hypothetical protein [Caudoviricetes sp.]
MDPFIETAILAEQTVKNAASLRDTTLKALSQKTHWRISQTLPPDFILQLDVETASKPLLDIYTRYDKHGYPTRRIQIPADQADPYTISELVKYVCQDGSGIPVSREGLEPSENVLLYDNDTDELEGRIELQ